MVTRLDDSSALVCCAIKTCAAMDVSRCGDGGSITKKWMASFGPTSSPHAWVILDSQVKALSKRVTLLLSRQRARPLPGDTYHVRMAAARVPPCHEKATAVHCAYKSCKNSLMVWIGGWFGSKAGTSGLKRNLMCSFPPVGSVKFTAQYCGTGGAKVTGWPTGCCCMDVCMTCCSSFSVNAGTCAEKIGKLLSKHCPLQW